MDLKIGMLCRIEGDLCRLLAYIEDTGGYDIQGVKDDKKYLSCLIDELMSR